ncbi:MAG: hypothetical protein WD512_15455, partial [Candidatus Paceibacterota bacterium]
GLYGCTVLYYHRRISLIIKNVTVENLWLDPMFGQGDLYNRFTMDIILSNNNHTRKLLDTTEILHQIYKDILSKNMPSGFLPRRYDVDNSLFSPHLEENKIRLKGQTNYTFISTTGRVIDDLTEVVAKKGDIIVNPSYCICPGGKAYVTYKVYQFKVVESDSILAEYIV